MICFSYKPSAIQIIMKLLGTEDCSQSFFFILCIISLTRCHGSAGICYQSLSCFWRRTPPKPDLDASTESFVSNFGSKYLRTGL